MPSLPCPAYQVLRLLTGKWKPAILFHLREQTLRFGDLRRCLPEVSQKVLTAQLKELEFAYAPPYSSVACCTSEVEGIALTATTRYTTPPSGAMLSRITPEVPRNSPAREPPRHTGALVAATWPLAGGGTLTTRVSAPSSSHDEAHCGTGGFA